MEKRARERARQQRQEAKRQKRDAAAAEAPAQGDGPDESALMEEFRILSERHAAGLVTADAYAAERHRIFLELGLESD